MKLHELKPAEGAVKSRKRLGRGTATGQGGATTHGWFAGYFELNNKMYTLVVVVPNINGVDANGNDLGGGNTAAPIYRDIVKSLMQ